MLPNTITHVKIAENLNVLEINVQRITRGLLVLNRKTVKTETARPYTVHCSLLFFTVTSFILCACLPSLLLVVRSGIVTRRHFL